MSYQYPCIKLSYIIFWIVLVCTIEINAMHKNFLNFFNYVSSVFGGKVKILRNNGPELWGVIQGRLHGIRAAKAPVVVVLDAHMEMREKWLEPLLLEIAKDPRTLASVQMDLMMPQEDGM